MPDTNLDKMSFDALRALKAEIDSRLIVLERERRDTALAAARETARAHGFELEHLLPLQLSSPLPGTGKAKKSTRPKKATTISAARYAKPGAPSITWTGRGRNPKWVLEHLAAGRPLSDLAIA